MSTTEDQIVKSDTAESTPAAPEKVATGKEAFAAARASLTKEPEADDTSSKEQPTQETVAADESTAAAEPDTILTPDELAALSPKERANAVKWQAKLTQKAQALAAQEKEFEQWKPLIDGLRNEPAAIVENLAKQIGLTISRPQDTTAKEISAKVERALDKLPDELRPLFEPFTEALKQEVMESFQGHLKPIAEAQAQMLTETAAAETQATIEAFNSKYPDWQKHETQMIELGKKFIPTAGAMTDFEYMEHLYRLVTAGQTQAEQTKKVIEKINKSAQASETKSAGVQSDRVEHVMPETVRKMDSGSRLRASYEAAKRGESWAR